MLFHSDLIQRATVKRGSDFAVHYSTRELARQEQNYYNRFPIQIAGASGVARARMFFQAGVARFRAAMEFIRHAARAQTLTH